MILEQVTQTVTIAGITARVTGCQIKRSRDQRVGEINFNLDKDGAGAAAYNAAVLNAAVVVTHSCLSGSIIDRGNIYAVDEESYGKALVKKIIVRTQEAKLQQIRVRRDWEDEFAGVVVNDIITDYCGPIGITAGSIIDGGRKVAEVTGRYDTLFDLIEQVSRQTGLAWDVTNNQLNLYYPGDVYGPVIEAGNFIDGTCTIKTTLETVINVARMQAYEYEYIEIQGEACSVYAKLPIAGPGWELSGEIVQSPLFFPDNFKVDLEFLEASWDAPAYPFYARFYTRRAVWVTVEDAASIALYGRREGAPLYHDGGITRANAALMLQYLIEQRAFPYGVISGIQPANFGHKSDTFAELSIPDRGITQDVYISAVTRAMDQRDLIVTLDVTTRSGLGKEHDPALEMMRRIERLERTGLHPQVFQGQPVSHPIISYPAGQTAVKNGDTIQVSGAGTPERTKGDSTVRDINNDVVPGSIVSGVQYSPGTGNFSGSFVMGNNPTDIVRLEVLLQNSAGASFADASRSNPLIVDNIPPTDPTILINGGAPTTNNPVLNLALSVTDGIQMFIDGNIQDAANVRTWVPFSPTQQVTAQGTGFINVSVQYRDGAHNLSTLASDSIEYIPD
jgi:hypothetical protein